jgi:hypothetical protein
MDKIFFMYQVLEEKRKYNATVHHLFIEFKKVYDSVRMEDYPITSEFGGPIER